MINIKICGLRREEDIALANRYRPEFAGFVFAESRRRVTEEEAAGLSGLLAEQITPVGVFVNAEQKEIVRICRRGIIRMVQLHGEEDETYVGDLREQLPAVPLIKAVRVRSREDIRNAEKSACDYLLLDGFSKGEYGGNGQQFDRELIPENLGKMYFLAGGLSPENVAENLAVCNPWAVDVSSAVETDGVKDGDKIRRFIERVRGYD